MPLTDWSIFKTTIRNTDNRLNNKPPNAPANTPNQREPVFSETTNPANAPISIPPSGLRSTIPANEGTNRPSGEQYLRTYRIVTVNNQAETRIAEYHQHHSPSLYDINQGQKISKNNDRYAPKCFNQWGSHPCSHLHGRRTVNQASKKLDEITVPKDLID